MVFLLLSFSSCSDSSTPVSSAPTGQLQQPLAEWDPPVDSTHVTYKCVNVEESVDALGTPKHEEKPSSGMVLLWMHDDVEFNVDLKDDGMHKDLSKVTKSWSADGKDFVKKGE